MKLKIASILFVSLIVIFNGCANQTEDQINTPNYNQETLEFLGQIIGGDTILKDLLILENARDLSFKRLEIIPIGFKFTERDSVYYSEHLKVSDEDIVKVYHQILMNNNYYWTSEYLQGKLILTQENYKSILHRQEYGEVEGGFWNIMHKEFGKGYISMSRPIFFNNGEYAFFHFDASWGYCKAKEEWNLYQKVEGRWELVRQRRSIICNNNSLQQELNRIKTQLV